MKKKKVCFTFTPEMADALKELSRRTMIPQTKIIEALLEKEIAADEARRAAQEAVEAARQPILNSLDI